MECSTKLTMLNLTKHKTVDVNDIGTDYFVGDVHGHYDELMLELKRVHFDNTTDRLFFLGDLCNRGRDSIKCIELLINPSFKSFTVEGNHEQMLLELANSKDTQTLLSRHEVGGQWALDCYQNEPSRFKFLTGILMYNCFNAITVNTPYGRIGLIHSQAPDDWAVFDKPEIDDDVLTSGMHSRAKFNTPAEELAPVANIDITLHGHTNSNTVVVKHNMVWIDTLRESGRLTLLSAKQLFDLVNL